MQATCAPPCPADPAARLPQPLTAQACGVPVAMSLAANKTLEELHAAAAFSRAAHPMEIPADGDSSMARLLQAVRRQADPPAAVTTALVALLHVPSRPRLAFPTGRPARAPAAVEAAGGAAEGAAEEAAAGAEGGGAVAVAAVGTKRKAPPEGVEGEGGEEEKLPDADNYLEGFPAVSSLMDQFRQVAGGDWVDWVVGGCGGMLLGVMGCGRLFGLVCLHRIAAQRLAMCVCLTITLLARLTHRRARGQPKTPLAVVHEYAARLNLLVNIEESGTTRADGTSGPPFTGACGSGAGAGGHVVWGTVVKAGPVLGHSTACLPAAQPHRPEHLLQLIRSGWPSFNPLQPLPAWSTRWAGSAWPPAPGAAV